MMGISVGQTITRAENKKEGYPFGKRGPNVDDRNGLRIWARNYKPRY